MPTSELQLPGVFSIVVTGGVKGLEGQRLTDEDGHVTIAPPISGRDIKQEWQISLGKDKKNVLIKRPGDFVPTPYLAYDGVPVGPKEGDRVVLNSLKFNEWHGSKGHLCVADSDLGIAVSPIAIYPPLLDLSLKNRLEWVIMPPPSEE